MITESLRWFADMVLCATVALEQNHCDDYYDYHYHCDDYHYHCDEYHNHYNDYNYYHCDYKTEDKIAVE